MLQPWPRRTLLHHLVVSIKEDATLVIVAEGCGVAPAQLPCRDWNSSLGDKSRNIQSSDLAMAPFLFLAVLSIPGVLTGNGVVALAYDETVWTRQSQSFQLPFPAQLVLSARDGDSVASLSSLNGPYDPKSYSRDATGELGRQVQHCAWLRKPFSS